MLRDGTNQYKRARQAAGLTQEAAAEVLDTSVESLKAYETGLRFPPNAMAAGMAEAYGTPWLAVEHLRAVSSLLALTSSSVRALPRQSSMVMLVKYSTGGVHVKILSRVRQQNFFKGAVLPGVRRKAPLSPCFALR